jgi:hypothetical protein
MQIRCAYGSLIFLLTVLLAGTAHAGLSVLEGEHRVVYDIVNPRGVAFIPDYANESFEQKVTVLDEFSKRVQVTTKLHPLKSRVPYPVAAGTIPSRLFSFLTPEEDRQSGNPAIIRLARELTKTSRFAHEAANAILSWIADNLTFDASISVPNDALSALNYKRAYCVGYSNLAVALLRAAGIPARVAHGYLPPGYEWGFSKDYWGVKVNDGGYHAYLEIFYPDTGWVFSDAEHSHHFVDPFHILLRIDGVEMQGAAKGGYLDVDKATFYTIFNETDTTLMVDELPMPREKRLSRRIDDRQHAALITGRVSDKDGSPVRTGTAVLWKDGRGNPAQFSEGRYAAAVSEPGLYRLEHRGPGYAKSSRDIEVEQGRVYKVNVTLPPGGVIKGRVVDAAGRAVTEGDVFYREGRTSYGVSLDRTGTYVLEGLSPGRYTVSVVLGDKEVSRTGEAAAGKQTVLDFVVH